MSRRLDPVVIGKVLTEAGQKHATRRQLYVKLERQLGRPVVAYLTSFRFPVMIESSDADMLEGILQETDLSKGLAVLISSPGGDILAPERIINVCRSYSGTGEYWAIVPSRAKSAATMICFGASRLIMACTSELGCVDPQVAIEDRLFSVFSIVKSYEELFMGAVQERGNLEPYLLQLANYDAREIAEFRWALDLAKDIAIKSLESGMMSNLSEQEIESRIKDFLIPEHVKDHGRPIYWYKARQSGLEVQLEQVRGNLWPTIYELYVRLDHFVSTRVPKCIETKDYSYAAMSTEEDER